MSFIQVTSAELRNKASELQGLNARLQSEIENLSNCHSGLTAMWEGEAKEAFTSAFLKDKVSMDNFKTAIDSYIQSLNVIAQRYEEAEKRNINTATQRSY